jgi:hypothetical protein
VSIRVVAQGYQELVAGDYHILVVALQPSNTPLGQRLAKQPIIADEDRPLHRTADGYGNDGENPAAGSQMFPFGRNMATVPEDSRDVVGTPCDSAPIFVSLAC